ncbi:hypothetical protein BDZ97DRAFT_1924732 [Flammula alnicola]|nr:hypothetical protein BDZ97DRAFT_1924732 [Flammula alnicola]
MPKALLSLPFDVLDEICKLTSEGATQATFYRERDNDPRRFEEFWHTRRSIWASPYKTRLVCKRLNDVLVNYLFRERRSYQA